MMLLKISNFPLENAIIRMRKIFFYVFDANMELSDTVAVTIDPQKASYYLNLIQQSTSLVME